MASTEHTNKNPITVRSIIIAVVFTVINIIGTVAALNLVDEALSAQANWAILPFLFLLFLVFLINPLCRLVKVIKPFAPAELLIVFTMATISSGLAAGGLSVYGLGTISGLFNETWNTESSEWNEYVVPFVNDAYFISPEGIQEASQNYRAERKKLDRLDTALDKAQNYIELKEQIEEGDAAEPVTGEQESEPGAEPGTEGATEGAVTAEEEMRERLQELKEEWQQYRDKHDLPTAETVIANYPEKITDQQERVDTLQNELTKKQEPVFDKVRTFRQGLPEELRAFPGFIPKTQESFDMYRERLKRLVEGVRAHDEVEQAATALRRSEEEPIETDTLEQVVAHLEQATEHLDRVERAQELKRRDESLGERYDRLTETIVEKEKELGALRTERRELPQAERGELTNQINTFADEIDDLQAERDTVSQTQDLISQELKINQQIAETRDRLQAIATEMTEVAPLPPSRADVFADQLDDIRGNFVKLDASLRQFLIGSVPWGTWARPLLLWGTMALLLYIVFMSLNVLIFRQWAYNERLSYPLAQVPEILSGHSSEDEQERHLIPVIFRSGLFWLGVTVAGVFHLYNLLVNGNILGGVEALEFQNNFNEYLQGTVFSPLVGSISMAHINFVVIGLIFLVPTTISFSLWFFAVVYMLQLLLLCWLGYGVNESSFSSGDFYTLNFQTAQGLGAMMVFSSFLIYRCRDFLFCVFSRKSIADLDAPEQKELRISSFLFITASIGLIFMLTHLGVHIAYAVLGYLFVLLIVMVMIRAAAEGGILGVDAQPHVFHFVSSTAGMKTAWTSPTLFSPLLIFFTTFITKIEAMIAPAMANGIKIRDDVKGGRLRFHTAVWLAIIFALVAGVATHMMFAYNTGAEGPYGQYHAMFSVHPERIFNRITDLTSNPPVDRSSLSWLIGGGLGMTALLSLRNRIFWLPHPIGLVLFIAPSYPAGWTVWFSFFIGWVARTLVGKFGNEDTYNTVRKFFIGLIIGPILVYGVRIVLYMLGFPIDFYGPQNVLW